MKSNFGINISLKTFSRLLFIPLIAIFVHACRSGDENPPKKDIVRKQELFPDRVKKNLTTLINYATNNSGKVNDTTYVANMRLVRSVYDNNGFAAMWSAEGDWISIGDSLNNLIDKCMYYGLFPSDYHIKAMQGIRHQLKTDSLAKKDAALWSRADVLLTDAFLEIASHLKRGRLPYDSTSRKDTLINFDSIYVSALDNVTHTKNFFSTLHHLEPRLQAYREMRNSMQAFVDTTTFREHTYLPFPYKDSAAFFDLLKKRLFEENIVDSFPAEMDSSSLRKILSKYQVSKKLKQTGKINENTIKSLNDTNWERFKRIAISLDKYKLMPDTMPPVYVWVNIPGYYLKVVEGDSTVFESKVIVGAPKTQTPQLYSEISNFITYPQWTVPYSIVFKEMVPEIQKDLNYLDKQNLMVVDRNDSIIDPSTIDWTRVNKKNFPYEIKQREGDDNSLGVLKFNFRNKYAVYLHDTNARWMFSKTNRALSHGCVRVQDWRELAHFLVRDDTIKYSADTLARWIVRQEKHVVSGFKKVPLFIRYFTCESQYGRIKFYEDIYGEDKILAERYFSKYIN